MGFSIRAYNHQDVSLGSYIGSYIIGHSTKKYTSITSTGKYNPSKTSPQPVFEKTFSSEAEYQKVANLCQNTTRALTSSFFITTRFDTSRNFCTDFFIPALACIAKNTNSLFERIIFFPLAILLDIVALPWRIITLIPSYLTYTSREEHPFHKYLADNNANSSLLDKDFIVLEKTWTANGEPHSSIKTFNFVRLPEWVSHSIWAFKDQGAQ